jgi:hypothetical protein
MSNLSVRFFFILSIVFSLFTSLANADDGCASWFCYDGTNWKGNWETGVIYGGGGLVAFNSDLRVGVGRINTVIDLEDDAGLASDESVFRAGAFYRLGRRHRFDFDWYDTDRTATQRLLAGVTIDDEFIGVNELLDTEFGVELFKINYQYNFWKDEVNELGLMVGGYIANINYSLTLPEKNKVLEKKDTTAPLPVIGLRYTNALTDKLRTSWSFNAFALELGDWKGELYDLAFGAEYNIWKNVGAGMSFNFFSASIENIAEDELNGKFDYDIANLLFYGKLYF